jgi:hypothetical protein
MDAWNRYYAPEHVETIMRRGEASGINRTKLFDSLTIFLGAPTIEGVHPLQFGFLGARSARSGATGCRSSTRRSSTLAVIRLRQRGPALAQAAAAEPGHPEARARRPNGQEYTDEALTRSRLVRPDHFVEAFADKIPQHARRAEAPTAAEAVEVAV